MKKIFLLGFLIFLSNCTINKMVVRSASGFMESGQVVLYREEDLTIAEHFLANNLKTIELLLEKDPKNQDLNCLAAQGFGAYAFGFVEDRDPVAASKLYVRGVHYGIRSLPEKKKFDTTVKPKELEILLQQYDAQDIPALFWTGYNWGLYVLQNLDKPENLIDLAKIELIMRRCLELDEAYYFYSVDLFFGAYHAARPRILGGNPDKGREFFLNNIKMNDNILLGKLFYAQYYARQTYNETLFDQLIDEILHFNPEQNPDYRLLNAIAMKKAQILKEKKSDYF
ncbi:MAG: hypothetical protein JXQ65_05290 [Candidatus Marinimicrobia bacterium]|nr:hypothetical protein [Candidatus Neomarinimicrobiota bacterium]